MKKALSIILLCISVYCKAQNIVLNPSFEDTIPCAIYPGPPQLVCTSWFWASDGSADFFSEQPNCLYTAPAPSGPFGFQVAHSGIAYTGLSTYRAPYFSNPFGREYIEGRLIDTLKAGHIYCVSFYVVAADNCKYLTDAMGACLTTDSIYEPLTSTALINYTPQVTNPAGNIINDTLNWILISGTYIAQGGEKYITIGNFNDNSNTNIDSLNNSPPLGNYGAYYFIDDVSVVDCTVGINELESYKNKISLMPNPAKNEVSYYAELNKGETGKVIIYSKIGIEISSRQLQEGVNNFSFDLTRIKPGVYIVETSISGKVSDRRKLVVVK